ncbi:MAG TPA: LysM peptidoglycan-binding domain-containing protein [Tepidisphaeraceae bacterium]|jgi:nucleoid-associated protein YgaU|nr:LysM peptidoglycan-binding domain-containing protein [Tepidisphaeraceae bacterium]
MRKDVRTGAIIGGLLIAVLILYGVVASRSHSKKPGGEPVALGTDKNTPAGPDAPGGTDRPDGAPVSTDPAPAGPADSAPTPAPNSGAPSATPPGFDSATPPSDTGGAKPGANWAALLSAEHVESLMPLQTQTPDASNPGARPPVNELPQPSPRRSTPASGDSATPTETPSTPNAVSSAPAASTNYIVKSGDTLSSIARATYGDARYYKKIMDANPKINPNRMRAGVSIVLPGRSQVAHESATTDADTLSKAPARHASPKAASPVDSSTEYRVASNDNLYRISMKLYHTPNKVDLIYQYNKTLIGPDPAKLKLNMVLKLPEPPTQTGSTR